MIIRLTIQKMKAVDYEVDDNDTINELGAINPQFVSDS